MQILHHIIFNRQLLRVIWKCSRCWRSFRSVILLSANICPEQFWMCSTVIPTVTVEHHGKQTYRLPCELSLSMYMHVTICRRVDQCATCSHVVSLCMMRETELHMWSAFASVYVPGVRLFYPWNNGSGMFCAERQTSVPTSSVCDLIAPSPPHGEIICRWFDVVPNGRGLVCFKWGFALQNTLITPIIFDITLNHDLRLL